MSDQDESSAQVPGAEGAGTPTAARGELEPSHQEPDLDELEDLAIDFLEGLLDALDVDGRVDAEADQEDLKAWITGEDAGFLIGRQGSTLDAIQELLRATVQHRVKHRIRVQLDVEGYRERRMTALVRMVEDQIEQARQVGEVELEPMSAYERKIVHDTVAAAEGVSSVSEGEDPDRRVVIRST